MSETYTIGGDALQSIGVNYYAAQSFTPREDHTLSHIDINLRDWHTARAPDIKVYLADSQHKPTGPPLSDNYRCYADYWDFYNVFRMRADMMPCPLLAGVIYVIVVHAFALETPHVLQWQYDKDNAAYPRGMRLISTDDGITWAQRPNDDHIFAEFGTPPVPAPPPSPPVQHFATLDIGQSRLPDGVRVTIPTNVPCHLTCYWTDKQPLRHHRSRIVRGLEVPWGVYFCFVAWHAVEQNEPGDTLYHTFDLTPWPYCETRWLTFRGTVNDVKSPSVGPIFQKHNSFAPYTKYEYYDAAFDGGLLTSATVKLGQTFTPQVTHFISQVVLLLRRVGLPGIMNVAIEGTTPTGYPNDYILTTGTFNANTLPTGPPPNAKWRTIPIAPYPLNSGTTYAIVLFGGDNDNKVAWNCQTLNPYPRGKACYWRPAPWFWWPAYNWDFLFEEWGYES